jgi:uncharacterized membrane protein
LLLSPASPWSAEVAVACGAISGIGSQFVAVQLGTGQALASNQMTLSAALAVVTSAFWLSIAEMVFG